MIRGSCFLLLVALLGVCAHRTHAATAAPRPERAGAVRSGEGPVLPFIQDDYAKARARKLPLFIESWAPW